MKPFGSSIDGSGIVTFFLEIYEADIIAFGFMIGPGDLVRASVSKS